MYYKLCSEFLFTKYRSHVPYCPRIDWNYAATVVPLTKVSEVSPLIDRFYFRCRASS